MTGRLGTDSRLLETLFSAGTACGLSDADLLERFIADQDGTAGAAFESLVLRHGPMVFDIGLKILGNTHDAQDVFQATFLILATRARSIIRRGSVASWLHGVALRVARRARSDAARRKLRESQVAQMTRREVEPGRQGSGDDFEVLHEEVERLPRKYREAVVLCYFEGLSLDSAASQLGCPIGTLGVRLMRARERLKIRLGRRGLALRAELLITAGAARSAPSALATALVSSTVNAVMHPATSGIASLAAVKLTTDILRNMAMIKLAKTFTGLVLLTVTGVGFGGFVVQSGMLNAGQPQKAKATQAPATWIGKKVVTKYSANVSSGNQAADRDRVPRLYTVKEIDGGKVKLVSLVDDVSGWIGSSEVLLVDQAIDFYTNELAIDPNNADAYFQRGLLWWNYDKNEKALADISEAVRLDPKEVSFSPRPPYIGDVIENGKGYEKAIADCTEAIRLRPSWARPYLLRGYLWNEKGDHDKAIADITEAIRRGERDWRAYGTRGSARLEKREYEKAIADLSQALNLNPRSVPTYSNRAHAWLAKEDFDKAIADYTEAIKIDPKSASAYRDRGNCQQQKGDLDKAISDFTDAIRLDPTSARDYMSRAESLSNKGEYDKAIADLDQAVKLEPESAFAYAERGDLWRDKMDFDKAIADLNQAIRLDPKDAFAYATRGDVWRVKNDYDKAIADLNQAIRLESQNADAYRTRGAVWREKSENDKAIADLDRAIKLDPESAFAYRNRGAAWSEKNEYDKAITDLNRALELDPESAFAYATRGEVWFHKREYDKAIADFDEAIRRDPTDARSYSFRGAAHWKKSELDRALADFNEAIRIAPEEDPYPYYARAWLWATCPDEKHRDGQKAVASATKACELTKWNDANYTETLAAAYAETGDFDSAVKWQTKANDLRDNDEDNTIGESRLKLYQEKKPYRDAES